MTNSNEEDYLDNLLKSITEGKKDVPEDDFDELEEFDFAKTLEDEIKNAADETDFLSDFESDIFEDNDTSGSSVFGSPDNSEELFGEPINEPISEGLGEVSTEEVQTKEKKKLFSRKKDKKEKKKKKNKDVANAENVQETFENLLEPTIGSFVEPSVENTMENPVEIGAEFNDFNNNEDIIQNESFSEEISINDFDLPEDTMEDMSNGQDNQMVEGTSVPENDISGLMDILGHSDDENADIKS